MPCIKMDEPLMVWESKASDCKDAHVSLTLGFLPCQKVTKCHVMAHSFESCS